MKAKSKFNSLRKPTEVVQSFGEQLKKDEVDEFTELADNFKKTPVKLRHSIAPMGPKSAEFDEVDPIYEKPDPIGSSIDIRKKAGSVCY